MSKTVLVYYPFPLSKEVTSGSKVRPIEMLKAFNKWGEDNEIKVIDIHGDSKSRAKQFNQLMNSGELRNVIFCYMENQTIPIWLTDPNHIPSRPFIDRKVLMYLKKNGIPVGIFYRDVYWKFDEHYPLKGIKKKVMQTIFRIEQLFYEKYMNLIFLPSQKMGEYVDINLPKVPLPPGGKYVEVQSKREVDIPKKGIYVGGISNPDFGLSLLLNAVDEVNREKDICQLTIVCRENEYDALPESEKKEISRLNVNILHISGDALQKVYEEMNFAFIPRLRNEYNDFSVPVKLVEYLSNELPIVATDCSAQKEFVESGGYGIICEADSESIAKAIRQIIDQEDEIRNEIQSTFNKNHSWESRVETVKNSLLKMSL